MTMQIPAGIQRIREARDLESAPTALDDGKALTYDATSGNFELADTGATDHGALDGLGDDDHAQYLLADGSRAGASSNRQAFTSGITTGSIRPASNSTTAIQISNATSGAHPVTIDTTNSRVGLGDVTPATKCHVNVNYSTSPTGFNANQHILFVTRQNANVSMALSSSAAGFCSIAMGDPDDVNACEIKYNHSSGVLQFDVEDTVQLDSAVIGPTFVAATGIKLHVNAATWTNPTGFNSNSDLLVIGRQTSTCGILIQADTDTSGYLYIGDVNDKDAGGMKYDNNDDTLTLRAGGADEVSVGNGTIGFDGTAASAYPTITGSRGGNAALASLLTALDTMGLITDSST